MKNKIFSLPLIMLGWFSLLVCMGFSSCSGDEEEFDGDVTSLITDKDGNNVRLTSIEKYKESYDGDWLSSYDFIYDSIGQLNTVESGYHHFDIRWNPIIISETTTWDGDIRSTETDTITLNNKGYITMIAGKCKHDYSSCFFKCFFKYDSDGHLTSYNTTHLTTHLTTILNSGETSVYNLACTLTWDNNKLTYVKQEDNVYGYNRCRETTFDYNDNEFENVSRQFTINLLHHQHGYIAEDIIFLFPLGMHGKGGDYLPVSSTIVEYDADDGEEVWHWTFNYSYGFNSDGTIAYESYEDINGSYYYYYTYDTDDDTSEAKCIDNP